MRYVLAIIDSISEYSGRVAGGLCVALVLVMTYETTARYVFNAPTVWAHVTATMIFGSICIVGLAYTELHKGHVRVDIIYSRLRPRLRAFIDVFLALAVLSPYLYVLIRTSYSWAVNSIVGHEVISESVWYPIASPFRVMVLVGLLLYAFQSVARFTRDLNLLLRGKEL